MNGKDLFVIYLIQLLLLLLPAFGIQKLFVKAGHPEPWKAWVPFLNTWEMQRLTGRPKHWVFWQLIPVVGWFITPGIYIEFVKLFGRYQFRDHAAASLVAPVYFPWLAQTKNAHYIGPDKVKLHKKSQVREWVDAAIFAVVAATIIRLFVFEAYTIPTGSMEKSLLVNDFLFVSKMSYGPRVPNTPLSFPFVHHTLPLVGGKSYVEWIKLPYIRWFASPVKRNDVVVFNFPANDTTALPDDSKDPYYDKVLREELRLLGNRAVSAQDSAVLYEQARQTVIEQNKILVRPVDKRENYVKRCVGIPGDIIEIKNGNLHVNGQPAVTMPHSTKEYIVRTRTAADQEMFEAEGVKFYSMQSDYPDFISESNVVFRLNLDMEEAQMVGKLPFVSGMQELLDTIPGPEIFPRNRSFAWSRDRFGPLWVPKKGSSIQLTHENYIKYNRAIRTYEGNTLEWINGQAVLNGKPAASYTFKMDYYWMMGDNRHKSQDSRYWGFVPEDHVVGKAWMIWMSWQGGPRWKRFFKMIH